jgi:hypothetical protein
MIFSRLIKSLFKSKEKENEIFEKDFCIVKIKLNNEKFANVAKIYEEGKINYRQIFVYVYNMNLSKMDKEIFKPLSEKAKDGCDAKDVFIRFQTLSGRYYVDIPLAVFSLKKNIRKSVLKKAKWYKNSIKKIKEFKKVNKKFFDMDNKK